MAKVEYNDFSGTSTPVTANPYDGILQACNDVPKQIQDRYSLHRTTRNAQQAAKILSPDFTAWSLDPVLTKLAGPPGLHDPDFSDPRHCLVFWARPPTHIKGLINTIQQRLRAVVPDIWLMPIENLHMTAMEVTHSLTAPEIASLVGKLKPVCKEIADLPSQPDHQARLIKPMVSFDAAALALSFVPAAGEALITGREAKDDGFTYHHLRRTLYEEISSAGIIIGSRYVVPSAHLTIARFNSPNPFAAEEEGVMNGKVGVSAENRQKLIDGIEAINKWLREEFWLEGGGDAPSQPAGEWIVGEEKGLDFRQGPLWYGGGDTVYLGNAIGQ